MCVWSRFSLGGIYGSQIAAGRFELALSLFGIPFIIGTLVLGSLAIMTVCGKMVVTVDRGAGRVFAGVGRIRWTRRFDWDAITRIEDDAFGYNYSGSNGMVIVLVGPTRLKFGSLLSDSRRCFVLQVLRKMLAGRAKPKG